MQGAIAPESDDRSPGALSHCLQKLNGAKLGIGLHQHHSPLEQGLGHRCQQFASQLGRTGIALAPPNPEVPGYSPLTDDEVQDNQMQTSFAVENPHPEVRVIGF
ncbi:hypothetical protein K9N68_36530 (plasmid) [Kovacikia minuta CCNUW1]|nr:hypothetical protein [Kovacikia minuta]UBF30672.1 hypothetical protein K9N68_36530 [Kovacikia minuta CCNUW1]